VKLTEAAGRKIAGYSKGKAHFMLKDSSVRTATLKQLDDEGKKVVQDFMKAQKELAKKKE
jgi:hypothetical protein